MIQVDLNKCTGCKRCESACAFFRTGRVNNSLARIKVMNLYEIGIDGPVVCIQCKERYCDCCPSDAITTGSLGQIIISPTLCTLCKACEDACPIGAIEIFSDIVYVCDLCDGKPRCVEVCTEGAITYIDKEGEHSSLKVFKRESDSMNPNQKRYFYLMRLGDEIRKKWRKELAQIWLRRKSTKNRSF